MRSPEGQRTIIPITRSTKYRASARRSPVSHPPSRKSVRMTGSDCPTSHAHRKKHPRSPPAHAKPRGKPPSQLNHTRSGRHGTGLDPSATEMPQLFTTTTTDDMSHFVRTPQRAQHIHTDTRAECAAAHEKRLWRGGRSPRSPRSPRGERDLERLSRRRLMAEKSPKSSSLPDRRSPPPRSSRPRS